MTGSGSEFEKVGRACGYRIEADVELSSDWLPASAFTMIYPTMDASIATAIEGVEDPEIDEVRIVHVATGWVV
ncbi:hypothetical protein [Pseudonocardia sp. ICBG1293]|uniref:hypothetical protein n=1 Tax=Pseudonocardia sp. ICBG1293 TaxID=2844382 RepID=UPI001CCB015A|nr:hypothetical protein [Pseudonocardia sp. ICBG1293]